MMELQVVSWIPQGSIPKNEGWKRDFRGTESLITNGDDLTVRKLIGLLEGGGGSSCGHFLLEVKGNIAKFFLDFKNNLSLSGGSEDLHEVVNELTVQTENSTGKAVTEMVPELIVAPDFFGLPEILAPEIWAPHFFGP